MDTKHYVIKSLLFILYTAICTNTYAADLIEQEQIAKFRIGMDLSFGVAVGANNIYYGITDFYSNEKSSIYKYDDTLAFELAGALRFKYFETEGFIDYISGNSQNAPNYYDYIKYPMDAIGTIVNIGIREHYYLPITKWLDLDFGVGAGWGFNYGEFTDEYDIQYYHQDTWSKNSAFYDFNLGIVLNWTQHFDTRAGYRRINYPSNKFGLKALNQGYVGVSYTF